MIVVAARVSTRRIITGSLTAGERNRVFVPHRLFFFGNNDDEEDENRKKKVLGKGADADSKEWRVGGENGGNENANSLSVPFGDNAPKINPILALPMNRRPIFPGFMSAIVIKDDTISSKIVKNIENGQGYVGIFMRKDLITSTSKPSGSMGMGVEMPHDAITHESQVFNVGTFAQVQSVVKTELGTQFLLLGHRRVTIEKFTDFGPPAWVNVKHWKRNPLISDRSPALKAYSNEVVTAARELVQINPLANEHMQQWVSRIDISDPYKLADFAAAMTTADGVELQQILEEEDAEKRLALALELLMKEKELAKLQRDISKQVEEKMSKTQRDYMLREQVQKSSNYSLLFPIISTCIHTYNHSFKKKKTVETYQARVRYGERR